MPFIYALYMCFTYYKIYQIYLPFYQQSYPICNICLWRRKDPTEAAGQGSQRARGQLSISLPFPVNTEGN